MIVSNFDLPAKADGCSIARGVCTGDSGYFQIGTLFQAWQAGIRISNFLVLAIRGFLRGNEESKDSD